MTECIYFNRIIGIQVIKSEDGGKKWEFAGQIFDSPLKEWDEAVPPHQGTEKSQSYRIKDNGSEQKDNMCII